MTTWQENAQKEFDSWSRSYDRSVLQRIFFHPSHDLIFKHGRFDHGAQVLDVGCGTGLFAGRIAVQHPTVQVTGLDISEGMLTNARRNCESFGDRVELVQGDAESLPFADNTFDVLTCVHSFHHYPRQGKVLSEMYRVLKPDGQLLIVDAWRDGPWGYVIFDWIVTTIEGMVHHCSAKEFRDLYKSAGFTQVEQYRGGHVAPFMLNKGCATKAAGVIRRAA